MKNLRILRKSWLDSDSVVLTYKIKEEGRELTLTIKEISLLFPSLAQKEVESIIVEKLDKRGISLVGLDMGDYSSFELRVRTKKDKEKIKETHKKVLSTFKEIFGELEKMEKERNLESWLWCEKEFEL